MQEKRGVAKIYSGSGPKNIYSSADCGKIFLEESFNIHAERGNKKTPEIIETSRVILTEGGKINFDFAK
jgi:hypothetical protein